MPHGETWLTVLLKKHAPAFYAWLTQLADSATKLVSEDGTWIEGTSVDITHVLSALLVCFLITVMALVSYRWLRNTKTAIIPQDKLTTATTVELLATNVFDMMAGIMGKKAARYFLPLIGTCGFIILFSNLLGLIPGFTPPTDNLNTNLAMALVIFLATHIFGVKEHGAAYFKHFLGPVWWLAPLLLLIEIASHLIRPLSLSMRLLINMYADHLVLGSFFSILGPYSYIPVLSVLMAFGLFVCVLQTFVFCILSTMYIGMAVEHESH